MARTSFSHCFSFGIFVCLTTPLFCQENRGSSNEQDYEATDKLYQNIEANVKSNSEVDLIAEIDHSRLAKKAGSTMPPARVIIWSDSKLEAGILKQNQLAAIDLPMRALTYLDPKTKKAKVIFNSYDYLSSRYELPKNKELKRAYADSVKRALQGIDQNSIATFRNDQMKQSGLVEFESSFDFAETEKRIVAAIKAQSDAVTFGKVDFASRSRKHGVEIRPTTLHLFGGPGPGGKAMASAPTLGLDGFCQKLLVWEDAKGKVHVAFNNLLALAKRQGVTVNLPLRVINQRLNVTFKKALER